MVKISVNRMDMETKRLEHPNFKNYTETVVSVTASSTTTLDVSLGNIFNISQAVDITTLNITNIPVSGTVCNLTLIRNKDATITTRSITWPTAFKWADGIAPSLNQSVAAIDFITATTTDGGVTWYALHGGNTIDTSVFATWNPNDKGANITLSGGNLTLACSSGNNLVRATQGKSSGKWYWESTIVTVGTNPMVGIAKSSVPTSSYPGADANGVAYQSGGNLLYNAGSNAYGASYTTGDVIGTQLDLDNGTVSFYKNNVFQGTAVTGLSGTWYPSDAGQGTSVMTVNFGATPLAYTPPNGTFWNPKDMGANTTTNNNMTASIAYFTGARTNTSKSSGKWYFEVRCDSTTASNFYEVGIGNSAMTFNPDGIGHDGNSVGYVAANGAFRYSSVDHLVAATYTTGDTIGVAVDLTALQVTFYKNGTSQGSVSLTADTYYPAIASVSTSTVTMTANFGVTSFSYPAPAGFSAWDSTVYNPGVF
jgi:hypothetical protein